MNTIKSYKENKGRAISTGNKFKYVMAITINPLNHKEGILRCIVSRKGDITKHGSVDRSKLFFVKGKSLQSFSIGNVLIIKNEEKEIKKLNKKYLDFIGLEDPDIFYDKEKKLFHLYFTMAYIKKPKPHQIHLGHAEGKNLHSLVMTKPVLTSKAPKYASAKEVSIAPINSKGIRYNLFESSQKHGETYFSTVRVAIAHDLGKPWKYSKVVLDPYLSKNKWIGGHASPGPLLPKTFIDLGPNLMLGIMNGCEKNKIVKGVNVHGGHFTVGLFIYDYEHGEIKWVSKKPFLIDSEAKRITFASQFIETKSGEGLLYAHVDDSFVRTYTLKADLIKAILPRSF